MPTRTAVILVVGLSRGLLGEPTPNLNRLGSRGRLSLLKPTMPAVTCSVQSSMLTGRPPREHGVVGNGWYNREMAEIQFWKQSNRLVHGEKVWETARRRDPSVTCAKMFWWYNMYSSADFSVTPRPMYKADGRKIPDCYSHPADLRDRLQQELGQFPLFRFWGPAASIESSRWIAHASMRVAQWHDPKLSLIYLPHLDYSLQKFGPDDPRIAGELREVDALVGELATFFEQRDTRIIVVSEYGIEPVTDAVHINRVLRRSGDLAVRTEQGGEILDAGASRAFAVADHQVAHVYVRDAVDLSRIAELCASVEGVDAVCDRQAQTSLGIDHARCGDLLLIASPGRWFSYYYWLDDARAPDFARTVDIHRKPGYDPAELFIEPTWRLPKVGIGWRLLKKKLGFRQLLDVIPLDASLVRGSHGRVDQPPDLMPVMISPDAISLDGLPAPEDTRHLGAPANAAGSDIAGKDGDEQTTSDTIFQCTAVRDVILRSLFE